MITMLDFLVVAFMALAVAGLVAVLLMFVSKNKRVRSVSLYFAAALGLYAMYVSVRIFWPYYTGQLAIGIILGLVGAAAIVLARRAGEQGNTRMLARIMATVSCAAGLLNAAM